METMGLKVGRNAVPYAEKVNSVRIDKAERDALESSKARRIAVRNAKSIENDLLEAKDGVVYRAGTNK